MRITRMFPIEILWAAFTAILYVSSYPPVSLWPVSIVAYGLLSWLIFEDSHDMKKAYGFWYYFRVFMVFSFMTRLSGLYWIPHTMIEFSEFPLPLAWLFGLLGFVLMSVPCSIVAGLLIPQVHRLNPNGKFKKINPIWRIFAIFAFWLVWDALDCRFFPWTPVQSFGGEKHLLASAGVLGTIGWNLIFYGLISLLHLKWSDKLSKRLYAWSAAWVVVLAGGMVIGHFQMEKLRAKYSRQQKIALLQGAVGNFEKRIQGRGEEPTNENVLQIYRDLIESLALKQKFNSMGEIFVFWPETAFPGFPLNDTTLSDLLSSWAKITHGFHLIGAYEEAPTQERDAKGQSKMQQYNVVAAYASNGQFQGHYRKSVLMPFGEFIPGDKYYPWIYDKFTFLNNFGRGERHVPLPHNSEKGPVFLPFICFEILDENYVREAVISAREHFPGRDLVFVNPTNDSWFGEGAELFLHSHLAIWQAAREGVPLVRPTNTGISMVIAPWGELLARGQVGVETMVITDLPLSP
jgi:apolipoprotein N-acyltransferase